MQDIKNKTSGFTLIETLIYIAIIGMTVTSLVLFTVSVSNARTKAYVVGEVQANTRIALDTMGRIIRSAESVDIDESIFGTDPGELVLHMTDGAKDPTTFALDADDGILTITEGLGGEISLVSNKVRVTNLVFTNLTASNTRESIRIEMSVAFNNLGTNAEYDYEQAVQTAVSVKK